MTRPKGSAEELARRIEKARAEQPKTSGTSEKRKIVVESCPFCKRKVIVRVRERCSEERQS